MDGDKLGEGGVMTPKVLVFEGVTGMGTPAHADSPASTIGGACDTPGGGVPLGSSKGDVLALKVFHRLVRNHREYGFEL